MTETELVWVAGLLEGEGCFSSIIRHNKSGPVHHPRIVCVMSDEDVIRRLHATVGKGRVECRGPSPRGKKPMWWWYLNRREDVVPLMRQLAPLMGARRRARIEEILASPGATRMTTAEKISESDRQEIVAMWKRGGITKAELGRRYGVSASHVSRLVARRG